MMAEQNPALCRHEIHTVFELARRNQFIFPEGEDFLRQKAGVEAVAKGKSDKDDSSESSGVHNVSTLASRHHPVQKLKKKGGSKAASLFHPTKISFSFDRRTEMSCPGSVVDRSAEYPWSSNR